MNVPEDGPVLAGADVGGSKTEVAVARSATGAIWRGRAISRPHRSVGIRTAAIAIGAVVQRTLQSAGLEPRADALVAGIAGAGDSDTARQLHEALSSSGVAAVVRVCTDPELVLADAFGAAPGIALIAGTGSIAMGRTSSGEIVRAGGSGPALGDPGSGHALGRAAVSAYLQGQTDQYSRRAIEIALRRTGLTPEDLDKPGVAPGRWAALAPTVLDLASRGHAPSRQLAQEAATELADLGRDVRDRFAESTPPVALSGGLLDNELYRALVTDALRTGWPDVAISPTHPDPARGAIKLASDL